ncbi:uncharacterized protein G2W53_004203 [Senna tora]|uniref:Uncharacterized protein n=1 Tax=Senna tora TaxID=362788 RepID=A0A835CJ49_9FABA|nr:uncharacterized protein G2W53_004203 [Senna tora]
MSWRNCAGTGAIARRHCPGTPGAPKLAVFNGIVASRLNGFECSEDESTLVGVLFENFFLLS